MGTNRFEAVVYEHAAALIGRRPWDVARDAELLAEAHAAAWARYRHRHVVAGMDLYNLEAEALGAEVAEPAGHGVPSVTGHACAALSDLAGLEALDLSRGRLGLTLDAAERLRARLPEAQVLVPVSGPFTLGVTLMGLEAFICEALADAADGARVLTSLERVTAPWIDAIAERGLTPIVFESAAAPPLMSPSLFEEVALPALGARMARIESCSGTRAALVVGGDTVLIVEQLLAVRPGMLICPAETDQPRFLARADPSALPHCRVNMSPAVFESGSRATVERELVRVMSVAGDRDNVTIGTGVLSYDADPALVDFARECCAGAA